MRWLLVLGWIPLLGPSRVHADSSDRTTQRADVRSWLLGIDGTEYEARPSTPRYDGDTGLLHLSSAYTLPKGKLSISLFRDNIDRDPKDIDISHHGLSLAFGATTKLEVFGSYSLQTRVDTDARFQPGFVNDFPFAGTAASSPTWQTGGGDVRLGAKLKLLDDYQGDRVALSVRGFVKLGTASAANGLGTGKPSAGIDLVVSKTLGRLAGVHVSIGYQVNGAPKEVGIGDAFNWGVGFNLPALRRLQMQIELTNVRYVGADFAQTAPLDFIVGPVVFIGHGFFVRPALSWNLNFDDRGLNSSSKSFAGRQISIGYHPGTRAREIAVPPRPPPPPQNRPPEVLSLSCRSPILTGESSVCDLTAQDPEGQPLRYRWWSNVGKTYMSEAQALFYSSGVQCGGTARISVEVSDPAGASTRTDEEIQIACAVASLPITGTALKVEDPFPVLEVPNPEELAATAPKYCHAQNTFLPALAAAVNKAGQCTMTSLVETELGQPPVGNSMKVVCRLRTIAKCRYTYRGFVWAEGKAGTLGYRVLRQAWIYKNCDGELTEMDKADSYEMPELSATAEAWKGIVSSCGAK
jgi:hypothetical protein